MTKRRGRRRGKCGKVLYRDEIAAKLALAELQRRDKGEQRIYRCNICSGAPWHLTGQEKRTGSSDPRSIDAESSLAIG